MAQRKCRIFQLYFLTNKDLFSLIFFFFLCWWPRAELTYLNIKFSRTCDVKEFLLSGITVDHCHRKHRCEWDTSFFLLLFLLPPLPSPLLPFFSLFLPPSLLFLSLPLLFSFLYIVHKHLWILILFLKNNHTLFLLNFLIVLSIDF